ncbi:hypothetical protein HYW17_03120 [Candidatus Uhrbacteria bacterium]|nr:hypothetical protein [Candidatus Uhrbacteria bacterium]
MLVHWLFKDVFMMVAIGFIAVVALTIILHAVMRPILRKLTLGDYEKFLHKPSNYVVQEYPSASHGGGALNRAAVRRHAERWAKLGNEWGLAMVACVAIIAAVMIFGIHTASQNSNPLEVITPYLNWIGVWFFLAIACLVPHKICLTIARWYENGAENGRLPPLPGAPENSLARISISVKNDPDPLPYAIKDINQFVAMVVEGPQFSWWRYQLRRMFCR